MISTRSVELVIDTVVCLTLAKWETVSGQFGGYLRRWRSVIATAVGSAGHSAGMTDGGSGDADTINSGPKWAAPQANLRDHAVRLRERRRRYCLCRSCDG